MRCTFNGGIKTFLSPRNLGRDSVAIPPERVAVGIEKFAEVVSFAESRSDTREHWPHVAAHVAAQVHNPAGGMGTVQVRNKPLQLSFICDELTVIFWKALGHHHEGESLATQRFEAAFRFVSPDKRGERLRLGAGLSS